jgi:hypothetical protein
VTQGRGEREIERETDKQEWQKPEIEKSEISPLPYPKLSLIFFFTLS